MSEDDDDDVSVMNVNSQGVRRGSAHIPSARTSFGDPSCAACQRAQLHGGCEEHRKSSYNKAVPVPAPYVKKGKL